MSGREKVLTALSHKEQDKVPVDLGGMDSTGIHGVAYNNFKKYLGIDKGNTKIYDPYQQVAKVEFSILEKINADVVPVIIEPRNWKSSSLSDGSKCEIPEKWIEVVKCDGSKVSLDQREMKLQ